VEAVRSSETSTSHHITTQRQNPEDLDLRILGTYNKGLTFYPRTREFFLAKRPQNAQDRNKIILINNMQISLECCFICRNYWVRISDGHLLSQMRFFVVIIRTYAKATIHSANRPRSLTTSFFMITRQFYAVLYVQFMKCHSVSEQQKVRNYTVIISLINWL
jgi:hypothetical protein